MGERERIKLTRTYCKSYMKFKAYISSAILSSIRHIYMAYIPNEVDISDPVTTGRRYSRPGYISSLNNNGGCQRVSNRTGDPSFGPHSSYGT